MDRVCRAAQGSRGRYLPEQESTRIRFAHLPKRQSSFPCAARACQAHGGKAAHPLPPLCKGRWAVDAARRGCCVLTNGVAQAFLALTVNPSVSLTADSSPCTGEPGSGLPRQKISLFPRAWIASAGLHRGAGGDTYRNKNPRASGLHICRKGNHLFRVRRAPVRRTAERLRTPCLPCARGGGRRMPLGGVVACRQTGARKYFLRLPSTPQSA